MNKFKSLIALLLVAVSVSFVACGGDKKDEAAEQQRIQDSIAKMAADKAQHSVDSVAAIAAATAAKDKAFSDSVRAKFVVDSTAHAKKSGGKGKPMKYVPHTPKPKATTSTTKPTNVTPPATTTPAPIATSTPPKTGAVIKDETKTSAPVIKDAPKGDAGKPAGKPVIKN